MTKSCKWPDIAGTECGDCAACFENYPDSTGARRHRANMEAARALRELADRVESFRNTPPVGTWSEGVGGRSGAWVAVYLSQNNIDTVAAALRELADIKLRRGNVNVHGHSRSSH